MENEFQLHLATLNDIPTLVIHRRLMFEEMYDLENVVIGKADLDEVDKAYTNYLQRSLLCGIAWSWVIRQMDQILASCVISLIDYPPNPGNPTGQMALLHGIYTESAYRRLGLNKKNGSAMLQSPFGSYGVVTIDRQPKVALKTLTSLFGGQTWT